MKHYLPNSLRALFLSLAVLLSLPMLAHHFEMGRIYYNILSSEERTVEVTFYGSNYNTQTNEYSGHVTIPESVTYSGITYSVVAINSNTFLMCQDVTGVTIPRTIERIGVGAFGVNEAETDFTTLRISDLEAWCNIDFEAGSSNPMSYAEYIYLNDILISDLAIPEGVKEIGAYAFYDCDALTSVTIPNSVTSIGSSAFQYCSGLTSVTIGNSVTSIGNSAFWGCSNLLDVYCYAENVPYTDDNAFYSLPIENATLHVPAASIESYKATVPWSSFKNIVAITTEVDGINYDFNAEKKQATVIAKSSGKYSGEVIIPESVEYGGTTYSVESIGDWTFYECSGLTSVTIGNSVESIGDWAFQYCSGLTSVIIPNSVTGIGDQAFASCSGLTSIVVEEGNTVYDSRNNCNAIIETVTNTLHYGCKTTIIPNSVTNIGEWAFQECSGLTSVNIPNSVKSIGKSAFIGCSGLTSIVVEEGNTVYDSRNNCNAIIETATNTLHYGCKTTIIPNTVTSIRNLAFDMCSGLASVTIPNSVKSIGKSAFIGCSGLTSIVVEEGNTVYDSRNNCNAIIETATNTLHSGCKTTIIPNSVTCIGDYAFFNCSALTSVTIPNSVTSIGDQAFDYCSGLLDVYCYAENVPATNSSAFSSSPIAKATLHVPDASINSYKATAPWNGFGTIVAITTEVDGINYDFNADTKQATVIAKSSGNYSGEVIIPEFVVFEDAAYSVTSIGEEAFDGCSALTSVTIPNSLTSIGEHAFYGCEGLTSVHISDIAAWCNIDFEYYYSNPLYYAHHLYLNGEEVKDLVIPNSVESIGYGTFIHCSGLTSVTIPNSVTSIGRGAFLGCPDLTSVTIPNSVTSIGQSAFDDCKALTSMTIPNSVTSIGYSAFYACSGLTSVIIGNSVTSIGDYAFNGCSGLTSVTIPNSVESIGYGAFLSCSGLTSVTIGSGVKTIGSKIFDNCQKVLDVYCYAEKVPSTESDAFDVSNYRNATLYVPAASINSYEAKAPWGAFGTILAISTEVDGINYDFDAETHQATVIAKSSGKYSGEVVIPESVEYGGTAYSVTSIGESAFEECTGLTSVTIPYSVTSIGEEAFYYCYRLTSVTIPNSVTSIGDKAFYNCSGLTSVSIPNSVTSIGEWAFFDCDGLTSVTIPNSVTSIGSKAFYSCDGLTSITIPNSVESIGNGAFSCCSGLASIVVEDGNPVYDSRNNCNAIIETATNTLHSGCKTTTIPNIVTSIGYGAFEGCIDLTSVTIPNSVTSIGECAFAYCFDLTSVTIGNGVTSIGEKAFVNCPELHDVYCYAENVPSTESDAFDGSYPKNATLYVPAASIDSYEAKAPWSGFGKIVAISESTSDLVIKDGESFENTEERELGTLTYTRTLPNRYWNPLYVPFKIPYEALKDNYDVAYINSMHSYDNDQNGEIDKMTMEVILVKNGVLKANHPYLIRAKSENDTKMELVLEDVTLYPTVSNKLDCSSVYTRFEITGTYKKMTRADLNGSLVITTSGAWMELSESSELKPFRFYLTITDRPGSPLEVSKESKSRINICVQGEDDFSTGIEETEIGNVKSENSAVYDLSGRRVQKAQKGIYIQNGKVMVK